MEGSMWRETLQNHGKTVINTQHNVVFHGECPLSARLPTQEVIRVALECPWRDLQDGIGIKALPYTPKQIDIGVARNRRKLEEHTQRCVCVCMSVLFCLRVFLKIRRPSGSQRDPKGITSKKWLDPPNLKVYNFNVFDPQRDPKGIPKGPLWDLRLDPPFSKGF